MAAISALEALKRPCRVDLHTDSQYLRNGVMTWIANWKRNGWRTSDKKPVKNVDLWKRLDAALGRIRSIGTGCAAMPVTIYNERADVLARDAIAEIRQRGRAPGWQPMRFVNAFTSSPLTRNSIYLPSYF